MNTDTKDYDTDYEPAQQQVPHERVVMPREFKMNIEPHTPTNPNRPCDECVLSKGTWMCLDKSYCVVRETGKTWRKAEA